MAYANLKDVEATLGRPISDDLEIQQVLTWIRKTERIIAKRLGALQLLDSRDVADVTAEVVARRLRNPEGKRNERIDDYGYGLDGDAAKAELWLTDAEWELLTPDSVGASVVVKPNFWTGGRERL